MTTEGLVLARRSHGCGFSGVEADGRAAGCACGQLVRGLGFAATAGNRQKWGLVMSEDRTTVAKRRRARRPTEAAARLDRLRQRNAAQLETQREAERRVETALQAYVDADVSIGAVERARDDKVAGLEREIEQARAAAQLEIEQIRAQQAVAAWQINEAGRTAEQISELLELPQKETRQLLRLGRTMANTTVTDRNSTAVPAGQQQPSEQPDLGC